MKRNYDDPLYAEWRKRIFRRDGRRCQMPSCSSRRRLQAHHIQTWAHAPQLRYDEDNGITLCSTCHQTVNRHEGEYALLFFDIVRKTNGKK